MDVYDSNVKFVERKKILVNFVAIGLIQLPSLSPFILVRNSLPRSYQEGGGGYENRHPPQKKKEIVWLVKNKNA